MTMAGTPREKSSRSESSRSRLPHSLAIALWAAGSLWAVAAVAYLLDADAGLIVPLMALGVLAGIAEWMMKGRNR